MDKKSVGQLRIFAKENIKVVRAHYLYSGLSLIAEIGGYVGLFLGISVIQVNRLLERAIKMICDAEK